VNPKLYWEDFPAGCARRIGPRRITAKEIVTFARQFDPQPFHVDAESAANFQFGGLIASGWHICALAMRMMCDESHLGECGTRLTWSRLDPLEAALASGGHDHRRSNGPGNQTFEKPPGCWNSSLALERQNQHGRSIAELETTGMIRCRSTRKTCPDLSRQSSAGFRAYEMISSWHYYMQ